ncbi:MAG: DUF4870 domain-containing protein [Bacteroidia bacterium]
MTQFLGNMKRNDYLVLLHVSQFAGAIVPMAGFVVPILLWATKKDEDQMVDLHGRIILNWLISAFILGIIGGVLSMIFIGIPILIVVGICSIVFPIIGAIKAANKETWLYPLSLDILGVKERMVDRWY